MLEGRQPRDLEFLGADPAIGAEFGFGGFHSYGLIRAAEIAQEIDLLFAYEPFFGLALGKIIKIRPLAHDDAIEGWLHGYLLCQFTHQSLFEALGPVHTALRKLPLAQISDPLTDQKFA